MVTEEQIKELAYAIWEQEGRPEGKNAECYFRAKQILEEQEAARIVELAPPPLISEIAASPRTFELAQSPTRRRSLKRAWLVAITTIFGCVAIVLILHIVHILPLPPVTSPAPTTPPIYTPTNHGWLGNW